MNCARVKPIPTLYEIFTTDNTIHTQMAPNISVKVVFVKHRTNNNEWLAILSTDCSLSEEEIDPHLQ